MDTRTHTHSQTLTDDVNAALSTEIAMTQEEAGTGGTGGSASRSLSGVVSYLDSVLPPHPPQTQQPAGKTPATAAAEDKKQQKEQSKSAGRDLEQNHEAMESVVVLAGGAGEGGGGGTISFPAARSQLAARLLSSQALSCLRLSDCLQKKRHLLLDFNNGL